MQMSTTVNERFKLVVRLLCWIVLAGGCCVYMCMFSLAAESGSGNFTPDNPKELPDSAVETPKIDYERTFDMPTDGEDPFSRVAILRANAVALKSSDLSGDTMSELAELIKVLIQEEASNIQIQSDIWNIEETKRAVDLLHSDPAAFPSTGYTLREAENGDLYVRDVIYDVLGIDLPVISSRTPHETTFPISFGYDTTMRRSAKFSFGNSEIRVTSGAAMKSGGAVGVSHGSHSVTIETNGDSTKTTINAGPVAAQSSISAENIRQELSVGELLMSQQEAVGGPGSITAGFRDFTVRLNTDPQEKVHGAEAGTKDFGIAVSRDFDDRINFVRHNIGSYSMQLDSDLADDRNHAYSARLTATTPETGQVVLGGGFDETNQPSTGLTLESRDMGIIFNGSNGRGDYTVRIGPFVFDVAMTGGLPDFILREITS